MKYVWVIYEISTNLRVGVFSTEELAEKASRENFTEYGTIVKNFSPDYKIERYRLDP